MARGLIVTKPVQVSHDYIDFERPPFTLTLDIVHKHPSSNDHKHVDVFNKESKKLLRCPGTSDTTNEPRGLYHALNSALSRATFFLPPYCYYGCLNRISMPTPPLRMFA